MSRFLTDLVYKDIDGESWELTESLVYESSKHNIQIVVPVGFKTDLASIPRFFHRVIPKSGLHNYAAVVHDYIYQTQIWPKELADELFYEGMLARGVKKPKAWAMYKAVDWAGSFAWNAHKKENSARLKTLMFLLAVTIGACLWAGCSARYIKVTDGEKTYTYISGRLVNKETIGGFTVESNRVELKGYQNESAESLGTILGTALKTAK